MSDESLDGAAAWSQFNRGAMGFEKQKRPGVGMMVGVLGVLVLVMVLVVLGIIVARG
ncbi:hypothetical protein V3N99_05385 [Dermatophilaceae bacterium Soc4.6]